MVNQRPSCPMPLEWHPAYRGKTWLMDWLDGLRPDLPRDHLPVPFFPPVRLQAGSDDSIEGTIRILRREKCRGFAPYVGHPFCYEWQVGVDDLGRWIAADATRRYDPVWPCWDLHCGCRACVDVAVAR